MLAAFQKRKICTNKLMCSKYIFVSSTPVLPKQDYETIAVGHSMPA